MWTATCSIYGPHNDNNNDLDCQFITDAKSSLDKETEEYFEIINFEINKKVAE